MSGSNGAFKIGEEVHALNPEGDVIMKFRLCQPNHKSVKYCVSLVARRWRDTILAKKRSQSRGNTFELITSRLGCLARGS